MSLEYHKKLIPLARALRKNMTPEERRLWYDFLVKLPVTVNRQRSIGRYIVDFYIAKARLAIEVDGSQHHEPEAESADREREACLREMGITVVRYDNVDVRDNFYGVCQDILSRLGPLAIQEADNN